MQLSIRVSHETNVTEVPKLKRQLFSQKDQELIDFNYTVKETEGILEKKQIIT